MLREYILASQICGKVECLHAEVSDLLCRFEKNSMFAKDEPLAICAKRDLIKLKDVLKMERNTYDVSAIFLVSFVLNILMLLCIIILSFSIPCRSCYNHFWQKTPSHSGQQFILWSSIG